VRLNVTFAVLNLCSNHNSGNTPCFNLGVYLHINLKADMACDWNIIEKGEGLLKVTGSHVHWKSDIWETLLHTDVVTTGH